MQGVNSNCMGFDYLFAKIPPKMHLESTVIQICRQFWVGVKSLFVQIEYN